MRYNNQILTSINKNELFNIGLEFCLDFLKQNNISVPPININNKLKCNGVYKSPRSEIELNLKNNKIATKNPGFAWSFPGFKADMTPIGVLAHEIGHHIHFRVRNFGDVTLLKEIAKRESQVSSYEPNTLEIVAESLRIFILNPDLLLQGRPMRYTYCIEYLKLKPTITDTWDKVLFNNGAHEKYFNASKNWIAK